MSRDGANELFDEIDANNDGKIDRKEMSQWARGDRNEGATSPSTRIIRTDTSTVIPSGTDTSYKFDSGVNTVFDQIDSNRSNTIDRGEFNRFVRDGNVGVDTTSSTTYVSRYRVDSRGFYVDPNPEIIVRPNPDPPTTYKQKIIIRYLKPPPLPPIAENIIREVRAPPLQAPPPFVIREGGKPGGQLPPLVLRERPPEPPAVSRGVEKTVIVAPLPAPPRSVVIERFPNLPDRPRDIILERWLPYEARTATRTVRIPAPDGPLPDPPRNRIIQYQAYQVSIVREFQRLGVTLADPRLYIQQYGETLLDSHAFLQQVRALGIVEDISLPTNFVVESTSSSYDQTVGVPGTYLRDAGENIITRSSEYTTAVRSDVDYGGYTSSGTIIGGSRFARGSDAAGTTVTSDEITNDKGGILERRF